MPHGKTLSVIVKALHVVLYDLTPGTKYAFKVRVIKDSHSSGFSVHAINKTFETGKHIYKFINITNIKPDMIIGNE